MRHLFYKKPSDDTEFLAVWDVTAPVDEHLLRGKISESADTAFIAEGGYRGFKFMRGMIVHKFFENGNRGDVARYAA